MYPWMVRKSIFQQSVSQTYCEPKTTGAEADDSFSNSSLLWSYKFITKHEVQETMKSVEECWQANEKCKSVLKYKISLKVGSYISTFLQATNLLVSSVKVTSFCCPRLFSDENVPMYMFWTSSKLWKY